MKKKGKRLNSMEWELRELRRRMQKMETDVVRMEQKLIETRILQNQQLLEIVRRPRRVTLRARVKGGTAREKESGSVNVKLDLGAKYGETPSARS